MMSNIYHISSIQLNLHTFSSSLKTGLLARAYNRVSQDL